MSFIGYDAAQVEVGNRTHLTVVLKENNQLLDDVVVIGYGVQKKVNLTGSVAVRQMSEIENQPMTHASQALYSMPGVYINQASSKPGSDGATIRIRGVGTMSSSSPMVLVDGMEYSLNELNPGDIETISVLKDASASIYGSKAANGVILITTKQAKKGAPVVKLSANFGIQSATYVPDVVTDPIQYMNMRNQAELNEGKLTVTYNRDDILEYEEGMKHDKYIYPASDWYDLCYQNGFLQQYNARVSGGTDNHLMLVDLRTKFPELTGKLAEKCLVAADITTNKNMVPFDSRSPFQTSGLRFGTPAITTRGLKEDKMDYIVGLIDRVLHDPENEDNIAAVRRDVNLSLIHI